MQEVHTFIRLRWDAPIFACTVWMFGFHRRLVRRWECETDLPKPGLLPQTSQTAATSHTPSGLPLRESTQRARTFTYPGRPGSHYRVMACRRRLQTAPRYAPACAAGS